MLRRRRTSERVEPIIGAGDGGRDGSLEFGLKDSDRSVPTPKDQTSTRAGKPRGKASGRRRGGDDGGRRGRGRRRRGGRRRGGGLFGGVRRLVRRVVYWTVVLTVISTGLTAAIVGYYASKLPPTAEWTVPARPANVRILASNGQLISNRGDTAGVALTLEEMPPYLPQAVIAIEDRRFYWHFGVDPIGLGRAIVANWRAGGIVQGGSTITQQLAKNLFLKPERTIERKIQEAVLAGWLELRLTKKEILELYLNRVYLGAGAYGVDAAAHRYFGKSARDVTLAEAAMLAGLLKAPSRYSPNNRPAAAAARTQVVLAAMRDLGFITARQASLAMSREVKTVRDVAGGSGRYVADWVMDILPGFVGAIDEDIIVDTTVDLSLQAAAARAISETLDEKGAALGVAEGALVAIDPNGAVKALVGGRDYAKSPFNRAVDGRRQPGSAFKPFVYLTALESGLLPETVRIDQPVSVAGWQPQNYSKKYRGPVTLQTALALSLNTVSVQLTAEVGPAAVVATARRLGITAPLQPTPSIALGAYEVTPLEMTAAFVAFSNGGRGVIAHVIRRITTAAGEVLYERAGSGPGQVIDPTTVGMMNAMLKETLIRGTGRRAQIADWPAAGKTGTSQDFRDAWFIGYTAALTTGVWYGNDDGTPTNKASGSNLPAITWNRFMSEALAGVAVADLPGDYRFRDPSNWTPPRSVAAIGEDDQPMMIQASPAAGNETAQPWPPRPRPRGGFLRRLFGG